MTTEFGAHQFDSIYPEGIENHYWNHSRNIKIRQLLKKTGVKSGFLEIGCGRGIVVKYLREKGFNCTGVELAPSQPGLDNDYLIFNQDATQLAEDSRHKVKVILLLDVIEHIESPTQFLNSIKEAFPNVEYYLITVPARQEIFSNYDKFNGHFLRYNKSKLKTDLSCLNGKVIYLAYLYRLLYIPAKLLSLLNIDRNTQIKAPKGFSRIIHRFLLAYFVLENRMKLFNLPGTSLITLVKVNKE